MKWISILQSLPQELENVILFDEMEGLTIGYRHFKNGFIQSVDGHPLEKVSHWMPAPEAPELSLDVQKEINLIKEAMTIAKSNY